MRPRRPSPSRRRGSRWISSRDCSSAPKPGSTPTGSPRAKTRGTRRTFSMTTARSVGRIVVSGGTRSRRRCARQDRHRGAGLCRDARDARCRARRHRRPRCPPSSVERMQAEALVRLCEHALGASSNLPLQGATVVVRRPRRSSTAPGPPRSTDHRPRLGRHGPRIAAGGKVIPAFSAETADLDSGRRSASTPAIRPRTRRTRRRMRHVRHTTRADEGPPHRVVGQGSRDPPTWQLVLLCDSSQHRIHDNGSEIRIEAADRGSRWFIPPPHVDPARSPRLAAAPADSPPDPEAARRARDPGS